MSEFEKRFTKESFEIMDINYDYAKKGFIEAIKWILGFQFINQKTVERLLKELKEIEK